MMECKHEFVQLRQGAIAAIEALPFPQTNAFLQVSAITILELWADYDALESQLAARQRVVDAAMDVAEADGKTATIIAIENLEAALAALDGAKCK